jgi:DNA-binding Lrp family transcriptional regulator
MFGSALTFFIISGSTDKMASSEYKLLRKNPNYQLIRTVFKLGILSLFSTLSLLILLVPLSYIPFSSSIFSEIQGFRIQMPQVGILFKNSWFYLLIFGCTIIPYLIYYYTAATWPKNSSFDLWAGVLQLIEPIISMLLGITLLNETFPISWILVIIFLLLIAIILKFISETEAQIYVVFFIKIVPQEMKNVQKSIMENREVKEIYNLIGEFDIYAYAQFSTSKSLNQFLLNTFQKIEGIEFYKMQIITNFALNRS